MSVKKIFLSLYFNKWLSIVKILLIAFILSFNLSSFFARPAITAGDAEESAAESKEVILKNEDLAQSKKIIDDYLNSLNLSDKSYERYITTELTDEYIQNSYMVDKYIIKNYKRNIETNINGDAVCIYEGDGEIIKQEFGLIKNHDGEIKVNSMSEKRYQKMNAKRRECYLNTRAVYKIASLLQVFYPDMQLPSSVDFELLKSKALLDGGITCPSSGTLSIGIVKNADSQNYEVLVHCSVHGDFFELYKLDEKLKVDFDKYNKDIDSDEESVLKKISGASYKSFQKIQPIEDAFYAAFEKQNIVEMFNFFNQALTIDTRLGNIYLTMIRAYKTVKNDKGASEIYNMAIKVYPNWEELKNVLSEKNAAEDEDAIEQ